MHSESFLSLNSGGTSKNQVSLLNSAVKHEYYAFYCLFSFHISLSQKSIHQELHHQFVCRNSLFYIIVSHSIGNILVVQQPCPSYFLPYLTILLLPMGNGDQQAAANQSTDIKVLQILLLPRESITNQSVLFVLISRVRCCNYTSF